MKLDKPMIILGSIQRAEKQVMKDKKTSAVSEMFTLVVLDQTRPASFRCMTPFITFITPEKLQAALATVDPDELTDMQVTLVATEVGAYNAFMKVKGQVVKGHHSGEAVLKMQVAKPDKKEEKTAK